MEAASKKTQQLNSNTSALLKVVKKEGSADIDVGGKTTQLTNAGSRTLPTTAAIIRVTWHKSVAPRDKGGKQEASHPLKDYGRELRKTNLSGVIMKSRLYLIVMGIYLYHCTSLIVRNVTQPDWSQWTWWSVTPRYACKLTQEHLSPSCLKENGRNCSLGRSSNFLCTNWQPILVSH